MDLVQAEESALSSRRKSERASFGGEGGEDVEVVFDAVDEDGGGVEAVDHAAQVLEESGAEVGGEEGGAGVWWRR